MDIKRLLNQEITVKTRGGYTEEGLPTFNPSETIKARVEIEQEQVDIEGGMESTINASVYTEVSKNFKNDDYITYNGVDYLIITNQTRYDIDGAAVYNVYKVKEVS